MTQGRVDLFERVESASAQCAEDAHENGLGVGAVSGLVAVGVLAQNHGGPDLALGEVIVGRHAGMIEKREQVALMPPQPLDDALDVSVISRAR